MVRSAISKQFNKYYFSLQLWVTFSSVATYVADFFNTTASAVNFFSLTYLIIAVPMCFISTYLVNRMGLRVAVSSSR